MGERRDINQLDLVEEGDLVSLLAEGVWKGNEIVGFVKTKVYADERKLELLGVNLVSMYPGEFVLEE